MTTLLVENINIKRQLEQAIPHSDGAVEIMRCTIEGERGTTYIENVVPEASYREHRLDGACHCNPSVVALGPGEWQVIHADPQ